MIDISRVKVLFSEEQIRQRIQELGDQISRDYEGEELMLICLLKGAALFMTDLSRVIRIPVTMDYMVVSSYGNSQHSSGVIEIRKDLDSSIQGKNVLIVEDIVDTGRTLSHIRKVLEERQPKSLRICSLLDKKEARECPLNVEYIGFPVQKVFLLGYGLDYEQYYRNLPYVGYVESGDIS